MKKVELVFIPSPGMSHLISTVEMAKLLLDRDQRLSITVLIMKLPNDRVVEAYTQKITSNPNSTPRLKFISLPNPEDTSNKERGFLLKFIDSQIVHVRDIVSNFTNQTSEDGPKIAGLVLDMFCTKFVDLGNEFGIPSYVFFTSGVSTLGLFQHLVSLKFEQNQDLTQFKDSDRELSVPCFSRPVPANVLPAVFVKESPMSEIFLNNFKKMELTKGVMVNTFYELESYAIDSMSNDGKTPKVYPVGPVLNLNKNEDEGHSGKSSNTEVAIKKWLDGQPENSVVFLCFGSMGSFEEAQVKEIAVALENSGHRFLWSLRKPGEKGTVHIPTEYEDFQEVMPEGFLDRTEGMGKVIGWAPQVAVLSHPAVGGFVTHCGWNSTLESVWFGVPMATFPLYAEQQLNAFLLVKELEMAEAIRIDYVKEFLGDSKPEIVGSGEIEAAIRRLMVDECGGGVKEKVKEMQNKSRAAFLEGGSSYNAQKLFIEDVIKNVA